MDEGIGSKIKRIMHSYQLLFSNVTSKAKSTRHVYIYKMTCMFLTTFIFKSLSPFRIPGLWMQVYIYFASRHPVLHSTRSVSTGEDSRNKGP